MVSGSGLKHCPAKSIVLSLQIPFLVPPRIIVLSPQISKHKFALFVQGSICCDLRAFWGDQPDQKMLVGGLHLIYDHQVQFLNGFAIFHTPQGTQGVWKIAKKSNHIAKFCCGSVRKLPYFFQKIRYFFQKIVKNTKKI